MRYPTGGRTARGMLYFAGPPRPELAADPEAARRLVAETFADLGWQVPGMLRSVWQADDFYLDRPGRVEVDTCSRGRVALLRDSAFGGSVGMGTSMALVGAYVLAGELAVAGGEHRAAFAAYQREMAEYVRRCVRPMPGGVNGMLPRTATGIRLRNTLTGLLLRTPLRRAMTGGLDRTANAITLRDYPQLIRSA